MASITPINALITFRGSTC